MSSCGLEGKYKIDERIGEGAQSDVFVGTCRRTSRKVAIKQIKPSVVTDPAGGRKVVPLSKLAANFREIGVLQRLLTAGGHPCIVELIEVVFDDTHVNIVMELCALNLAEYIGSFRSRRRYSRHGTSPVVPIEEIQSITHQIVSGLDFVHSQLVLHRDLKPQNIFVSPAEGGALAVKLGDFGLAKALTYPLPQETLNVASLWYRAPEVLLQSGYDVGIDLWSVGCIIGELGVGCPLFRDACEFGLLMRIFQTLGTPTKESLRILGSSPNYSTLWPHWERRRALGVFRNMMECLITASGHDLMMAFLDYDSNKRIRCHQALQHDFLLRRYVQEETDENAFGYNGRNGNSCSPPEIKRHCH